MSCWKPSSRASLRTSTRTTAEASSSSISVVPPRLTTNTSSSWKSDPSDAHAWLNLGATLTDPEHPDTRAGLKQADQLIEIYSKALACNPYLVVALYRLQQAYIWAASNAREEARKAQAEQGADSPKVKAAQEKAQHYLSERDAIYRTFEKLDRRRSNTGFGEAGETYYGEMGRYATVLDPFPGRRPRPDDLVHPQFSAPRPAEISLPPGHLWVQPADFSRPENEGLALVGRARNRFGPAVSVLDANMDGRFDLFLSAAVRSPQGVRDALLINQGDGAFTDASAEFGLPVDRASLGAAAADFDADGFPDLFLTGPGGNVLLRNNSGKSFEDVTSALKGEAAPPAVSPSARWLDLDQDGDLDLIVLNYTSAEHATEAFSESIPPGLPNTVYRNDGIPPRIASTTPANDAPAAVAPEDREVSKGLSLVLNRWTGPDVEALLDGDRPHTGVVSLDLDVDRDLDLVITADGSAPSAAMNDRLGRFRQRMLDDLAPRGDAELWINGAVVLDLDRDGRSDLVLIRPRSRLNAWRNTPVEPKSGQAASPPDFALAFWPIEARLWRSGQAVDLDFDGWSDLLGVRSPETGGFPVPRWARNEGNRVDVARLNLAPATESPLLATHWIDLTDDPRPDLLLVFDGKPPQIATGQDNGNHWLGLNLNGRWKFDFDFMRSNPHGLGTFVYCEGPGLEVPILHTPSGSTLGQSTSPLYFGLGPNVSAALLHLRWPDGVMQAELNLPGNQTIDLAEHNRKTGSCPVLFSYDGQRMVCIGDFLGGGGLGYLVSPGVYSQPDRDEAVLIRSDQLAPVAGHLRFSVVEPMDELAYLDRITLDVVDAPPGLKTAPEERFAPGGNRPSGALLAWRRSVEPVLATDLKGRDVSKALRALRPPDGGRIRPPEGVDRVCRGARPGSRLRRPSGRIRTDKIDWS